MVEKDTGWNAELFSDKLSSLQLAACNWQKDATMYEGMKPGRQAERRTVC